MLLIIFGAGASYDHSPQLSYSVGSRIPLTYDLIEDTLTHAKESMLRWPGAIPVLNRLRNLKYLKKKYFNLEEELYKESKIDNESIQAQLLSFKFYLFEVIQSSQKNVISFNQANTNYTRLLTLLQIGEFDKKMGLSLISFNYDTLLDIAYSQVYPNYSINSFEDYINNPIRLYKPHGSLNWRNRHNYRGVGGMIKMKDRIKILSSETERKSLTDGRILTKYNDHYELEGQDVDEPMISLPYKEKTIFTFPEAHKKALIEDISRVTHIISIGWRGTEQHFHDEIISKIPKVNKIKLFNVSGSGNEALENLSKTLGERVISMGSFQDGFSKFLGAPFYINEFLTR